MENVFYLLSEYDIFVNKKNEKIEVFKWTGNNEDFIYSNNQGIGIGCGYYINIIFSDKYGLYIDKEFYSGESNFCSTFNNEILSK